MRETGARLASLAALYHQEAADLVTEAMAGDSSQRLGVAQVAARNLAARRVPGVVRDTPASAFQR